MTRPNTREYNEWLPELQREVAAGKDLNILGMSIPTDTTPGHLGLAERVHKRFDPSFEKAYKEILESLEKPLFDRGTYYSVYHNGHVLVCAFQIYSITIAGENLLLTGTEKLERQWVGKEFIEKYNPEIDGYCVVDECNNCEYIPEKQFEATHRKVNTK